MNRARFDIGPAPTTAPSTELGALTAAEYRAIRYSIATRCRGESPEVAARRADSETARWLADRSTAMQPQPTSSILQQVAA